MKENNAINITWTQISHFLSHLCGIVSASSCNTEERPSPACVQLSQSPAKTCSINIQNNRINSHCLKICTLHTVVSWFGLISRVNLKIKQDQLEHRAGTPI